MLTALSLWAIYFASYLPDYFLILGILIWKHAETARVSQAPFWKGADFGVWGLLLLCICVSIVVILIIQNVKMNTRIKAVPGDNITIDVLGYVAAQVIAAFTTVFTDWWIPINVLTFIITGVIFVKSKKVHHALIFVFPLFNRIYQAGGYVIITNYKDEEMRMAQEDSLDGIEARELTKGIFYVRK